jgi:hypothetical protein
VEVGQGPWHSVNSDIYHNNPDCQTGGSIDPENIRPGTGGQGRAASGSVRSVHGSTMRPVRCPLRWAISPANQGEAQGSPQRAHRPVRLTIPSPNPRCAGPGPLVAGWTRKKRPVWKRASVGARGGRWTRKSEKSLAAEGSTAAR